MKIVACEGRFEVFGPVGEDDLLVLLEELMRWLEAKNERGADLAGVGVDSDVCG